MPICIHCATPIESLYMRYGQDHIVLSPCTSDICSTSSDTPAKSLSTPTGSGSSKANAVVLADEYLEHDLPIVIIDLILAKPQAYRHLLFNRSSIFAPPSTTSAATKDGHGLSHSKGLGWGRDVWELAKRIFALSLVDAYIRWFYMCVQPPLATWAESEGGKTKLSEKLASMVQMHLPIQAGIFFPSLFTPRSTSDLAIATVCSATPLFTSTPTTQAEPDAVLSTLLSYLNVLLITLIESSVLHLTVSLLTLLTIRSLSSPHNHHTTPFTPSKALLLSQLSPLLLLTFVLLWSTKFPHPHSTPQQSSRGYMVWIIRTFLASLNAGVAIATVLPKDGGWVRRVVPAAVLAAAWSVQAMTSGVLYRWLS